MVRGIPNKRCGCDFCGCMLKLKRSSTVPFAFDINLIMSAPTRTVYSLEKYSRATPHEKQGGKGFELEWHHHTTPVLRLLLEIRRTHAGNVESARMRVVHTRMSSANGTSTHENTVLVSTRYLSEIRAETHT